MKPELIEERAVRLVDRLRARGVIVWASPSGGAIFMTPVDACTELERAFAAANPAAIAVALEPDADEQHALDRRAARLARIASRRPRPPPRRRAKAEAPHRRRFFSGLGA